MSEPPARGRERADGAAEPAPAGAFVAVLQKRARFLVAEPLFAERDPQPRGGERRARVTLSSGRSRRDGGPSAEPGDIVLVRRAGSGSAARVVRVLGRPDVARDVIEALLLDRGAPRGFDRAVRGEARAARDRVLDQARRDVAAGRRRDLRALTTFTIDPVTARDFDDAISAEPLSDGVTRVWVHIADVAAHVPEGSLVDREARERATSIYVPGIVEPMLPEALSEDACSLRPGADRPAVTVELQLRGAEIVSAAFHRSLIRSDARLDYERIDRIFAGREPAAEPWGEPLRAARGVAAALAAARERRGALVVDSEEPEFLFDQSGNVSEIRTRVQTESHRLIEHLMIAANEAVAGLLAQRGVPCLYRVHERPDPERIERLVAQLASLDVATPPLPDVLSASRAAELLGPISRLVDQHVRRTGHGRIALSSLVLRSLKQAYYSPQNIGHAGLGSQSYCHFTSPIRRYPDLVCHRALLSTLGGEERPPRASELAQLGAWTSERERHAMTIERDADDVARCFVLERALFQSGWDQVFEGEVVGLISAGAFATFGEVGAPLYEGMLHVRRLAAASRPAARRPGARAQGAGQRAGAEPAREWWELNEQGTILRGERTGAALRLGQEIEVRVASVEPVRGRVDLIPAGDGAVAGR